jgi:aminopeptidase N
MTRRSPLTIALIGLITLAGLVAGCAPIPAPPALPDPTPIEVGVVPPPGPYAPGFSALHYHIALAVPAAGRRIDARTTILVEMTAPRQDTLRLDLTGLRTRDVRIGLGSGGVPGRSPFHQADGRLVLPVPASAAVGDTLHVHVEYGGEPTDGLVIGENVHGEWGAFGDNWPNRARFWFPSIDHPSQKATVSFEVDAPTGWRVLANGRRADAPAHHPPPADGVWRYELPVPIPTYLMVIGATRFAVGVIDECADGGTAHARPDSCVPVTSWTFPPDSAHGMRAFRRAGDMIRFYSGLIAPYPYTKLAHAQAATRFGGMENAGAIFHAEQAIADRRDIEGTVAHETAHQWFGNSVTPHDWPHLWLSEGFATYFGALYFEHADGPAAFRERIAAVQGSYLSSDVRHLAMVDTVRIPGDNLLGLLNANSYQKGGAVLHMLRGLLGDDAFFDGVRRYYATHAHGTAVTADLRLALERQSGRDLGWFFHQWAFRPGHPVIRFDWRWDAGAGEVVVDLEQTQDPGWPTFRLPIELAFVTPAGEVRRAAELVERRHNLRFPLPAPPSAARMDPDGWLLHAPD